MVSLDKLATLAGDESESVRQLVATVLSRNADAKWTTTLIKLVQDKTIEVAREAAVGLGKIANEQAMQPLLDALGNADKDSRQKFLEALRDGVGGKGLVLALDSVDKSKRDTEKFQTKQIFDMLRVARGSARGRRARRSTSRRTRTRTGRPRPALRLAEIGDVRAVPTLAWRMKQDPLKLYNKDLDPDYRQDDNERVVAARMLADLAVLHPDKRAELRAQADDGVLLLDDRQAAAARERPPLPRRAPRRRRRCRRCASGRTRASRSRRRASRSSRRSGRRRRARSATSAG